MTEATDWAYLDRNGVVENERAVHHARHDTVSEPWSWHNRMSNVYRAKRSVTQICLLGIFLGVFGLALLWMTMGDELWRQLPGDDANGGLGSTTHVPSTAEERNSSGHKWAADSYLMDEMNLDSAPFWQAYAADRYAMLTGSVSPKYLVFEPQSGLGNRMSGMMSTFVLSVAYDRVFLHHWEAGDHSCTAGYDDLFVPPFEPWFSSARVDGPMSSPDGLLGEQTSSNATLALDDKRNCSLDLTQAGVSNGDLDTVFLERRGEDPKPDCRVLFVKTNQYLVELLSSPAYGNATVGGVKLSEWLSNGMAIDTLFSGLFRPLPVIRQRVELASERMYPATMNSSIKTVAAHARSWQLRNITTQHRFVECLERWARSSNASSVVLATDMPRFAKESEVTRLLKGITVMVMEGVQRTGEGHEMRNSVQKIQDALAEMLLVGKASIIVTSPKSSFSALAAAQGGMSSQRVGGTSCTKVSNEPEFHLLGCKVGWSLDWAKWSSVYPFAEDIRRRCAN